MANREKEPIIPETGEIPLGFRIRARRWFVGISPREMAQVVGNYHPGHIANIERGRDKPSESLLGEISRVLEISVDELKSAPKEEVESWVQLGRDKIRPTGKIINNAALKVERVTLASLAQRLTGIEETQRQILAILGELRADKLPLE